MKCPYAVNRQTITQSQIEYNAEGLQTGWTEIQKNNAAFVDCLEGECGAYNKITGRCEYYQRGE